MKPLYFCLAFIFINNFCYPQWVQQVSGTPRNLFGIDMIDASTGYVSGEQVNRILKTTNGGTNWIGYTEPTGNQYYGISFTNALTGLAVGPPGLVLRTSNGGLNWSVISQPGYNKGEVHFVTPTVAYAVGDDIIKTSNGGLTWVVIRIGSLLGEYKAVYFINQDTGTVVGLSGLILTTANGGLTWTQRIMYLPVHFGDSTLYDVMYVNALTGYACGDGGIVVKTTNGGANWAYKPTGTLNYLQGVYFTDANTGTVVGYPVIWRTTNGANNWIPQSSPLNYPLWELDFVNQDTGWIVGFNGLILKTTNGGFTWIEPISGNIPSNFKLEQNYPNPFNPTTKIRFDVPPLEGVRGRMVRVIVYDVLGREVTTLVNEQLNPGTYEVEWNASDYPSGVYFYTLSAGSRALGTKTRKAVLIK